MNIKVTMIFVLFVMVAFNLNADDSEDILLPYDPAVGESILYQINKTDEFENLNHANKPASFREVSITYIGEKEDGHVYNLQTLNIWIEGENETKNKLVIAQNELLKFLNLEYIADETGYPLAIRNLEELKFDLLSSTLPLLEKSGAKQEGVKFLKALIAGLTPESAAEFFLRDIIPIFALTASEFSSQGCYEGNSFQLWNLTGSELIKNESFCVTAKEDYSVSVFNKSDFDRESVQVALAALLEKYQKIYSQEEFETEKKKLKGLEDFDMRDEMAMKISLIDGLPLDLNYTRIINIGKGNRKINYEIKRIEASSR